MTMRCIRDVVLSGLASFMIAGGVSAATIGEILEAVRMEKSAAQANGDPNQVPLPDVLRQYAAADAYSGSNSRVLNLMNAGLAAFEIGEYDYSLPLLRAAYESIETVYANDPQAERARSSFVADATKEFKGDAYERAMVGYYLGLSFMMKGDTENARASFRWGEFQDTMSASEVYQADMALLQYLKAWNLKCMGGAENTAMEEFTVAQRVRATLTPPAAADNTLILVETGNGPIKTASGQHNELLGFSRGAFAPYIGIAVMRDGVPTGVKLGEDLYFQASTRGGREVDKILAGKASFKDNLNTTADIAEGVGEVAMGAAEILAASGALDDSLNALGLGLFSSLISAGTRSVAEDVQPAADTRYWQSLPDRIHVATLVGQPGQELEVKFFGPDALPMHSEKVVLKQTGNCLIGWTRDNWVARGTPGASLTTGPVNQPTYQPASVGTDRVLQHIESLPVEQAPPVEPEEEVDVIITF